jgi:hypothetical protein
MNIGPIELLFVLLLYLTPAILAIWLAARKALEPLWVWVLVALLFPWIMVIVALVMPSRQGGSRA